MKEILKQTGIVIHNQKYKDTSSLISVLSKNELMTYQVKGVEKAGSGTLKFTQLLTKLSFNYANGSLRTLTDAYIDDNYSDIKLDLNKYNYALIIMEKLNNFYSAISEKELIYDFFNELIEMLKITNYPKEVALIFEVKLLYLLGVSPIFKTCVNCGRVFDIKNGVFNFAQGGMICDNCKRRFVANLNGDESTILKKIYVTKIKDVDEEVLLEYSKYSKISEVVDEYYRFHLEFDSKVKKVMKELNK